MLSNLVDCYVIAFNNRSILLYRWSRRMCGLQLDFFHFDITDENNCESSYLDVGGKQLCGNMTGRKSKYI